MTQDEVTLDFEHDIDVCYYCGICSNSFDENEEFAEHLKSANHKNEHKVREKALKNGANYCSLCIIEMKRKCDYDVHKQTDEHREFATSMSLLKSTGTSNYFATYTAPPSGTSSCSYQALRERVFAHKIIGLSYLSRRDDNWVCDLCLEVITESIDDHCIKAVHAIQFIKIHDPQTAFTLKALAISKQDKDTKRFKSLVLAKAKELFEVEKDTPEFQEFMKEYKKVEDAFIKPEPEQKEENVEPNGSDDKLQAEKSDGDGPSLKAKCPSGDDSNKDAISLFEDSDREVIPDSPEVVQKSSLRSRHVKQSDSNLIVGLEHLGKRGRIYYCKLCDIAGKTSLPSIRNHFISSLHRKNILCNKFNGNEVHNYLEKMRTNDAAKFNSLLKNEIMKIEAEERTKEDYKLTHKRAEILNISVATLPPPSNPVQTEKDIVALATEWNAQENESLFLKQKNPANDGANKMILSPITPEKDTLLVGVGAIKSVNARTFHCTLCDIKWNINAKKKQKGHVNGRLHKLNALIAAYGSVVDEYFKHRITRESYVSVMDVINKSCILLEKEEIESETTESKNIRSKILGLKPGQIHLPSIVMSNDKPFDVKQAAAEWKGSKKTTIKENLKITIDNEPSSSKVDEEIEEKKADKKTEEKKADPAPKAKNIFDLCKPLEVKNEVPSFNKKKTPPLSRNIDIDSLQRNLIDADFIPVASDKRRSGSGSRAAPTGNIRPDVKLDLKSKKPTCLIHNKPTVSSGTTPPVKRKKTVILSTQPSRKPSIRSSDVRKPEAQQPDERKNDVPKMDVRKPDASRKDVRMPETRKPAIRKTEVRKTYIRENRTTSKPLLGDSRYQSPNTYQKQSTKPYSKPYNNPSNSTTTTQSNFNVKQSNIQDAILKSTSNMKSNLSNALAMVTNLQSLPKPVNPASSYGKQYQGSHSHHQYENRSNSFNNHSSNNSQGSINNDFKPHNSFQQTHSSGVSHGGYNSLQNYSYSQQQPHQHSQSSYQNQGKQNYSSNFQTGSGARYESSYQNYSNDYDSNRRVVPRSNDNAYKRNPFR